MKLNNLEDNTGMTYQDIVAQAASKYQEVEKAAPKPQALLEKTAATKKGLAAIEDMKKKAS